MLINLEIWQNQLRWNSFFGHKISERVNIDFSELVTRSLIKIN